MTPAKRIGRYPVIREIGKGAMGTVYEGFDPDTGEKVAIKILRAEHLGDHRADSASARFEREAQATRRLRHPNIVAVREYGEQGRIKFIAMEFLNGRELRQLMRERGRFELDDAVFVLLQLLDALGHSHQHGVVHRDIKPSNVMVLQGLQVKVMDFGIARIESAAFTQMGTLLGTPTYMSPEQMRGEPADGRADLWAAGVMLYEMLVGRSPFAAATPVAVMQNAMALEPAPVSSLVAGLPTSLDAVLRRALARRRDERFQAASEFAGELVKAAAAASDAVDLDLALAPLATPAPAVPQAPAAPVVPQAPAAPVVPQAPAAPSWVEPSPIDIAIEPLPRPAA
ncbi:MAG: serine/threonine protein kinase [Burkholderiales bacterium]|nr:serine/threonine protein kinase [Burkholderiales bacterium]